MNLTMNKYKEGPTAYDLSTDCWSGEELVAVCTVNINEQIAITYHTAAYDSQLDPYFKQIERLCIDKFIFESVSKENLFQIRASIK